MEVRKKFPFRFILTDEERKILRENDRLTDASLALNERLIPIYGENPDDVSLSETCHKISGFVGTTIKILVVGGICVQRGWPYWLLTSLETELDIARICDLGEDVKKLMHLCLESEKKIFDMLEKE
ncbi:MAG: hypothetical protein R2688_03485 [Fimbriimonadaceae bacterium]